MRYLGSKIKLLEQINEVINLNHIEGEIFADLFAGTGCVGDYFKDRYKVISNDFLYYSFVFSKAKLMNASIPKFKSFKKKYKVDIFDWLNSQRYEPDDTYFIYNNYTPIGGRMFFTEDNGVKIDGTDISVEGDPAGRASFDSGWMLVSERSASSSISGRSLFPVPIEAMTGTPAAFARRTISIFAVTVSTASAT